MLFKKYTIQIISSGLFAMLTALTLYVARHGDHGSLPSLLSDKSIMLALGMEKESRCLQS